MALIKGTPTGQDLYFQPSSVVDPDSHRVRRRGRCTRSPTHRETAVYRVERASTLDAKFVPFGLGGGRGRSADQFVADQTDEVARPALSYFGRTSSLGSRFFYGHFVSVTFLPFIRIKRRLELQSCRKAIDGASTGTRDLQENPSRTIETVIRRTQFDVRRRDRRIHHTSTSPRTGWRGPIRKATKQVARPSSAPQVPAPP